MASGTKKQKFVNTDLEESHSDSSHVTEIGEHTVPSKDVTPVSTPTNDTDKQGSNPNSRKRSSFQRFMTDCSGRLNDHHSGIPRNLCNWERKHIEKLNIEVSFQPDIPPLQFIHRKIKKTGLQICDVQKIESDEEEKKIASLVKYVQQSKFMEMLAKINYKTFNDLSRNSLRGLDMYADDRYQCSFIPDGLPDSLKLWFYRFHTHGKMFAYILHKMVENKEEGVQNYECLFQHLFDTFAKMFGMVSVVSFVPCLQMPKLNIMDTEVCGATDIVYSHHSFKPPTMNGMNSRIVAICKVVKERPIIIDNKISSLSSKTREASRKQTSTEAVSSSSSSFYSPPVKKEFPSMSDKLIGQHGGELLSYYHQSNRCDLITGLVIQETHVTFTTLEMTDYQYQRIKDGNIEPSEKDRPVFTFSKAYDFLKEEDLVNIIEPLIRLGLEQDK